MGTDRKLSAEERLELIQTLNGLIDPQFKALVFALDPPPGVIPADAAALGDRVPVLLHWAEKTKGGPGLAKLQEVLDRVLRKEEVLDGETGKTENGAILSPSVPVVDDPDGSSLEVDPPGDKEDRNETPNHPSGDSASDGQREVPDLMSFTFETVTIAGVDEGFLGHLLGKGKPRVRLERRQGQAQYYREDLGGGVTLDLVRIPEGRFWMGSPANEKGRVDREGPQHRVIVSAFFMGKYSVTQRQWHAVSLLDDMDIELKPDPSYFKGDNRPVEQVSWDDAVEFCKRLSKHTGREYRLPTEAEWEYACRAGTNTPFHFGETITTDLANYRGTDNEFGGLGSYGQGPKGEYRRQTTSVGSFNVANAFGLYDMHGNVLESCLDHWHGNYEGAPTDGSAWVIGGDSDLRVRRGGSWVINPRDCRSAYRSRFDPGVRIDRVGFRVCCSPPRTP